MLTRFEPPSQALPFTFGPPDKFAELRAMLERMGYRQEAVYERLDVLEREEQQADPPPREPRRYVDRLGVLVDLFRGVPVPRRIVQRYLDERELGLLADFSLVLPLAEDPDRLRSTVLLYPTESFYIVSDLNHHPAAKTPPPPDVVYPAITKNTQQFLSLLPHLPCERFLELCAGTGIAALVASRFAGHAWAVDITERSTRFAQFNVLLNGIQNVTAIQGDLYEPVRERTFDFIVAHPPYVPTPRQEYIFRDGGEDGEEITRRILAGLPAHLEPGGRFYCACMATDRRDAPLEERVRATLGADAGDFDVVVLQRGAVQPGEYYAQAAVARRMTLDEATERADGLEQLGVEHLVYGSIIVQRRREPREVFTVRQQIGPSTDAKAIEWLLQWHVLVADPAVAEGLLEARPIATPGIELRVIHRAHEGQWQADACSVAARYPFIAEADCSVWVPQFIARCDGTVTVRDHLRMLKERGMVREQADEGDFAGFVRRFLDQGFLQLDNCRIPATPAEG